MSLFLSVIPSFWDDQIEDKQLYEYQKFKAYTKRTIKINSQAEIYKSSIHKHIGFSHSIRKTKTFDSRIVSIFSIISSSKSMFYLRSIEYDKLGRECMLKKQNRKSSSIAKDALTHFNLDNQDFHTDQDASISDSCLSGNENEPHDRCLCMINTESKMGWLLLQKFSEANKSGYRLKERDLLKMGRITFKIRETKKSMKVRDEKSHRIIDHAKNLKLFSSNQANMKIPTSQGKSLKFVNLRSQDQGLADKRLNISLENRSDFLLMAANKHFELQNPEALQTNALNNSQAHLSNKTADLKSKLKSKLLEGKINLKRKLSSISCRICLIEQIDDEDPLINPCKCQGSISFIHIECLRKWLESKLVTKIYAFLIVHSFKDLKCEICQAMLPERIFIKGSLKYLINLQLPEDDDYIILETVSEEKKEVKFLYIIHMPPKTILLMGRSADCDIRMTDISISRVHAYLENKDGQFYIKDNNSKFGSLIKLQADILVLPGKDLSIQFNDCIVNISLVSDFCSSLCRKPINFKCIYEDYNDYLSKISNFKDCSIVRIKRRELNEYANDSECAFIDEYNEDCEIEALSSNKIVDLLGYNQVSMQNADLSPSIKSNKAQKLDRKETNHNYKQITLNAVENNFRKAASIANNHISHTLDQYLSNDGNQDSHKSFLSKRQLIGCETKTKLSLHRLIDRGSSYTRDIKFNQGLQLNPDVLSQNQKRNFNLMENKASLKSKSQEKDILDTVIHFSERLKKGKILDNLKVIKSLGPSFDKSTLIPSGGKLRPSSKIHESTSPKIEVNQDSEVSNATLNMPKISIVSQLSKSWNSSLSLTNRDI